METSDVEAWGTHKYCQQNMADGRLDDGLSGNNNTSTATITAVAAAAAAAGKPIRRRSRASKRTLTTLVNANANNFRALVQQFTGNHTAPPPVSSTYKGPINLNFAASSSYSHPDNSIHGNLLHIDHQEHDDHHRSLFSFGNTSTHEAGPPSYVSPTVPVQVQVQIPMTTLTPVDFHMESFSGLQDRLLGPGDYTYNSMKADRNDDFCWVGGAGDTYN